MIVERIRILLKEKNIYAKDMLKDLGINKDQLKRWEDPNATIKPIYLNAIANYLDTTIEYLLGKTEEKGSPSGEIPEGPDEICAKIITLYSNLEENQKSEALSYLEFLVQKKQQDN